MEVQNWIPQDDYDKAIWQLRSQLYGVFDFMKVNDELPIKYMYGMGDYIPGAVEEMVRLAEDFSLRCRKVDKPISLEMVRKKKRRK